MSVRAYDWVAYHANQTPDKVALIDLHSSRRFTYAQMQDRTARLANGLAGAFNVGKGDRVAVLSNNTTDCMELEFACMKLGAVYVPLNWRLSVPELERRSAQTERQDAGVAGAQRSGSRLALRGPARPGIESDRAGGDFPR
jgi:acyl-CoA synthetase (AMP-forming)/AMP-acid ligase II